MPEGSPAKPLVGRVLDLMRQVIEEGRTALQGLRSSDRGIHDLAQSFSDIQRELALDERVDYRVRVEGHFRPVHPIIRDEVYRIGREAVANALRRAQARHIEVAVEYKVRRLRIVIRDDGRATSAPAPGAKRDAHRGLRMQAEAFGARLRVRSRTGVGTAVELTVPGYVAFPSRSVKRPLGWLAGLYSLNARQGFQNPGREESK